MAPLPPIAQLLPHRPPMLLVDEVLEHQGGTVVCKTTIRDDMLFVKNGEVSTLLALELFAQSAASLVALGAGPGGASLVTGAFLGTRKVELHAPSFKVGDELRIHCRQTLSVGVTTQIACQLFRGEELVAEGSINVMAGTP